MHFADKGRFICKAGELLNENGVFCLSIDKSLNDTIDTGIISLGSILTRPMR